MALTLNLDLHELTYGALYRFADQARAAGVPDDQKVEQITEDNVGNDLGPFGSLTLDLGEVDSLVRPVLIDGVDAQHYAEVLGKMLAQETLPPDESGLDELHNLLLGLPARPA